MQKQIQKKVCIIGCGSTGMFGSLLLDHFGVNYITIEKQSELRSHSNGQWVSASTKVLFRQIPGLIKELDLRQESQKWEFYECFKFVESLFGYELASTNFFKPTIKQKLRESSDLFGEKPSHIPQSKLIEIMHRYIKKKDNIRFGQEVTSIHPTVINSKQCYIIKNCLGKQLATAEYIVLCNGSSSKLRDNLQQTILSFNMIGFSNLGNIVVIHFQSKTLAQEIIKKQNFAMKYLIYNKKITAVLNSLSLAEGIFSIEITNYEPFVDLLQIYEPNELLLMMFEQQETLKKLIKDAQIIHTQKKQISAQVADKLYSQGVFLAGSSAHSFPNYVESSFNLGFQDIHQFVHSFLFVQQNDSVSKESIFKRFCNKRSEIGKVYLKKAEKDYEAIKQIQQKLGLTSNIIEIFSSNSLVKSMISKISQKKPEYMQKIRLKALSHMYKRIPIPQPPVELFDEEFELISQNQSFIKKQILASHKDFAKAQNSKMNNLFIKQWFLTEDEVVKEIGNVDFQNIKFYNGKQYSEYGEKMILSDGTVVIL